MAIDGGSPPGAIQAALGSHGEGSHLPWVPIEYTPASEWQVTGQAMERGGLPLGLWAEERRWGMTD